MSVESGVRTVVADELLYYSISRFLIPKFWSKRHLMLQLLGFTYSWDYTVCSLYFAQSTSIAMMDLDDLFRQLHFCGCPWGLQYPTLTKRKYLFEIITEVFHVNSWSLSMASIWLVLWKCSLLIFFHEKHLPCRTAQTPVESINKIKLLPSPLQWSTQLRKPIFFVHPLPNVAAPSWSADCFQMDREMKFLEQFTRSEWRILFLLYGLLHIRYRSQKTCKDPNR